MLRGREGHGRVGRADAGEGLEVQRRGGLERGRGGRGVGLTALRRPLPVAASGLNSISSEW